MTARDALFRRATRLLAASVVFALFGSAPPAAASSTPPPCTAALLHGRYVFTGQGFIEPIEPGVERVHYGLIEFDGRGRLAGKQTSSRGGRIGREALEGSYTISADCSGTLTFRHVARPGTKTYGTGIDTHWDMYLTADGRTGHLIRTDEGTMAVRTFHK